MPGRCRVTDMSIEVWHGRSGAVAPSPARRDAVSLRRGRLEAENVWEATTTTHCIKRAQRRCQFWIDFLAPPGKTQRMAIVALFPIPSLPIPSHNPRPVPAFKDETTHSSRRLRLRETAIQL